MTQSDRNVEQPAAKASTDEKRTWVRPALTPVGSVNELLQGGGSKISPLLDPGEARKPRGQG